MYILFIADFDENGSDVNRFSYLEDVIEYLGWEDNEDLVSELTFPMVLLKGEWHQLPLGDCLMENILNTEKMKKSLSIIHFVQEIIFVTITKF